MIGRPEMRNCHRCGAGPFAMYIFRCDNCQRLLLTARDMQYASLVGSGDPNKVIAYKLGVTEGTVKVSLSKLFTKLGVANRVELALWALQMGLATTGFVIPNGTSIHPQT